MALVGGAKRRAVVGSAGGDPRLDFCSPCFDAGLLFQQPRSALSHLERGVTPLANIRMAELLLPWGMQRPIDPRGRGAAAFTPKTAADAAEKQRAEFEAQLNITKNRALKKGRPRVTRGAVGSLEREESQPPLLLSHAFCLLRNAGHRRGGEALCRRDSRSSGREILG